MLKTVCLETNEFWLRLSKRSTVLFYNTQLNCSTTYCIFLRIDNLFLVKYNLLVVLQIFFERHKSTWQGVKVIAAPCLTFDSPCTAAWWTNLFTDEFISTISAVNSESTTSFKMFAHNHSRFVRQHIKWLLFLFFTLIDNNTHTHTHNHTCLAHTNTLCFVRKNQFRRSYLHTVITTCVLI